MAPSVPHPADLLRPILLGGVHHADAGTCQMRNGSGVTTGHRLPDGDDAHGVPMPSDGGGNQCRRTPATRDVPLRQTFRNMEATLHEAGASWGDVVALHSYHVGLHAQADALLEIAAEFLAEPYPAWTAVGVTELIDPPALVEISCEALLPDDR